METTGLKEIFQYQRRCLQLGSDVSQLNVIFQLDCGAISLIFKTQNRLLVDFQLGRFNLIFPTWNDSNLIEPFPRPKSDAYKFIWVSTLRIVFSNLIIFPSYVFKVETLPKFKRKFKILSRCEKPFYMWENGLNKLSIFFSKLRISSFKNVQEWSHDTRTLFS